MGLLRQSFIQVGLVALSFALVVTGCEEGPPPEPVSAGLDSPAPMEPEFVRTDIVDLRLEDVAPVTSVGASRGSEACGV